MENRLPVFLSHRWHAHNKLAELQRECREATARLRAAMHEWWEAHRLAQAQMA